MAKRIRAVLAVLAVAAVCGVLMTAPVHEVATGTDVITITIVDDGRTGEIRTVVTGGGGWGSGRAD